MHSLKTAALGLALAAMAGGAAIAQNTTTGAGAKSQSGAYTAPAPKGAANSAANMGTNTATTAPSLTKAQMATLKSCHASATKMKSAKCQAFMKAHPDAMAPQK